MSETKRTTATALVDAFHIFLRASRTMLHLKLGEIRGNFYVFILACIIYMSKLMREMVTLGKKT
ncbi:hypothetical protein HanXRQr2_Chr03g0099801 [Helianthus annuus]|uniref:Uncharacterized protein n=1 Tax=Helianthus annuus TaxID=4232 RepID=A0A9K3NUC0_HELAN|nr:hypothetical protein HanXRQr2_Chr03g0099801 [Helianthus annuus]KAJ0942773.1 hypothetical protein HanPSC8_Chr03g0096121 [Helianthus annuus]